MSPDDKSLSRGLLGAAFASCVLTSVPGFTLFLANQGLSNPDLRALAAELVLGSLAAVFGTLQIQAQTRSRGKWIGLAPLAAFAIALGAVGLLTVFSAASGTTEGGPIVIFGFLLVIVVVGANLGLAALTWFLLSELVKGLARDEASGIDQNIRASKWLGVAAVINILLKCTTGGPSVFGFFAAVLAVSLALRSKRNLGLVLGALSIAASVSTAVGVRLYFTHKQALEQLPLCEDLPSGDRETGVVSSHVRAMPGVADVMVYLADSGPELTVVVLPIGGGSVSGAMKDDIVRFTASSGCVVDNGATKPRVAVVDPKYAEFSVVARVHLAPGGNENEARDAVIAAVHDWYEPRVGSHLLRDPQTAGDETPSTPQDAGMRYVDWMTGSDDLGSRIDALPIGSVATIKNIDVQFVDDQ